MTDLSARIARAAALLRAARTVVALTGAGLSTPSGIPDFRSPGAGLWEDRDPFEFASLSAFRYHPEKFYSWVRPLAARIHAAQPNAAHHALVALETAGCLRTVITQNIDGLHRLAGQREVLEIHGSLTTATCRQCHHTVPGRPPLERFIHEGVLPVCESCGGILKPDVILMEEQLPALVFQRARDAVRQTDLLLVAGSSLEVMPAAGLPLEALRFGARLIIVNLGPTFLDERADVLISADVAEALPSLVAAAGLPVHA
ncbi:MAG: Sir2 family NAD-dependent protein deacetylase [Anaerolineales bacterium]|nr:Sir2 family NAD-dependent protein deacetylase [Anaerolineales bacterium]